MNVYLLGQKYKQIKMNEGNYSGLTNITEKTFIIH